MTNKVSVTESDKLDLLAKLRYYNSEDKRITWEELAQSLHTSRRKIRATIHEINADDSNHLVLTDTELEPGPVAGPARRNTACA